MMRTKTIVLVVVAALCLGFGAKSASAELDLNRFQRIIEVYTKYLVINKEEMIKGTCHAFSTGGFEKWGLEMGVEWGFYGTKKGLGEDEVQEGMHGVMGAMATIMLYGLCD